MSLEKMETYLESNLLNRGVTREQHDTKMNNLRKLAIEGYLLINPIAHGVYVIAGKDELYNPYTDKYLKDLDMKYPKIGTDEAYVLAILLKNKGISMDDLHTRPDIDENRLHEIVTNLESGNYECAKDILRG